MRKIFLSAMLILFCLQHVYSQDSIYARKVINTLCSKKFHGRGYVKNGDGKAAHFLEAEFKRLGLETLKGNYFQSFQFPVNSFPGKMTVCVNGKKLIPGVDYIVSPSSSGVNSTFDALPVDSSEVIKQLSSRSQNCLVIDLKDFNSNREKAMELLKGKKDGAIVFLEESKLTWSVAQSHYHIPVITVLKDRFPVNSKKIKFHIKAEFNERYNTQNVIAAIKGKEMPDSFIVFSAHYDHLGRMGRHTYFPGANDNASGTAMLLNLAAHYIKNPPRVTVLFMAFAGEEAGLVGSKYFTENPLIDLKRIKMLINLDLLGTGVDGLMVVNATEYKKEFEVLKEINSEKKYFPSLGERGKASNSDHYYFSEKGVPSFFLYTMGGIKAYHDIYDKPESLPLTKFKESFMLIRDFADSF